MIHHYKPQAPDLEEIKVKEQKKSGLWGHCPKCDWWYKQSVLDKCPMCRHKWTEKINYKQPPYESSSLSS